MPAHFRRYRIDGDDYVAETRTMLGFWTIRGLGGKHVGEVFQHDGRLWVRGRSFRSLEKAIRCLVEPDPAASAEPEGG